MSYPWINREAGEKNLIVNCKSLDKIISRGVLSSFLLPLYCCLFLSFYKPPSKEILRWEERLKKIELKTENALGHF